MARYINENDLLVQIMDLNLDHVQGDDGRELCQIIQTFPTADVREVMSSAWIPCEEKLPKFGWYLTSSDTGYNTTHVGMTLYNGTEWEIEFKVKAWMPLPDPYGADA